MTPRQPLRRKSEDRCQLLPVLGGDEMGPQKVFIQPPDVVGGLFSFGRSQPASPFKHKEAHPSDERIVSRRSCELSGPFKMP